MTPSLVEAASGVMFAATATDPNGFDALLASHRFGSVCFTTIVYTDAGTDWWARKLHP